MCIGGCGFNAMNDAQGVIYTNMHFHAEVPFITYPGLMHVRISLTRLFFCRRRCTNNSGINEAAFFERQALFFQVIVILLNNFIARPCCTNK